MRIGRDRALKIRLRAGPIAGRLERGIAGAAQLVRLRKHGIFEGRLGDGGVRGVLDEGHEQADVPCSLEAGRCTRAISASHKEIRMACSLRDGGNARCGKFMLPNIRAHDYRDIAILDEL